MDSPRGNSISRISINFRCWHSNCVLLGQHVIRFCRPADSCGLVRRSRCVAAGLTRWRKAGVAQQASSGKGKTGFLLLFTGQLHRPAVPGAVWGQCLAAQALASFVDPEIIAFINTPAVVQTILTSAMRPPTSLGGHWPRQSQAVSSRVLSLPLAEDGGLVCVA